MIDYDGPYWLMGLPFDALDMDGAIERIHASARSQSRLLFVTPNVNFVVMAEKDSAFRDTVLRSQLSLVDGMPLVWLGRSLGIPFTERVAGSSLLERLAHERRPLRIYFFGGPPDAARLASERLPALGRGLVPVGYHTPGFGSIELMSTPDLIDGINRSGADLLVVALGAKKGHEWIARNLDSIHTPVISHLGASINFLAGTIARSPSWMQTMGLEWAWRVLQEPGLARRYWNDGRRFIPAALAARKMRGKTLQASEKLAFKAEMSVGELVWFLEGDLTYATASSLQTEFDAARARNEAPSVLNVSQLGSLDAAGLGVLYALLYRQRVPVSAIICSSPKVRKLFRMHRAQALLEGA